LSKNSTLIFPRKIVELFWVKTRENAAVLDFLAVYNFDFTRILSKKILGEKFVKMSVIRAFLVVDNFRFPEKNCKVLSKLNFLDKNLTFRIVV